MIDFLLQLFVKDPIKGVLAALLLGVCWLSYHLARREYARRETQLTEFKKDLTKIERNMSAHMHSTRSALETHSENMGKATKAINGDMQRIQAAAFEMKSELLQKIGEVQEAAMKLAYDTKTLAQVGQMAAEKLEERFEIIRTIKDEIKTLHGKVYRLEETSGDFRVTVAKHEERHRQIAQALDSQRKQLDDLRGRKQ